MGLYTTGRWEHSWQGQVDASVELSEVLLSLNQIQSTLDLISVNSYADLSAISIPFSTSSSIITNVGWNFDTPTNLESILDGNPDTATTWGRMQGGGNTGYIQIDLGEINRYYLNIKLGIRMNSEWNSGEAFWFITMSPSLFTEGFPIWGVRARPSATEQIGVIAGYQTGRFLRIGTTDTGAGQPELRVYDLKVWKIINT